LKIGKPETFNGKRDASSVENWLFTLQQYLQISLASNPESWVSVASTYLRDAALVWWRTVCSDPVRSSAVHASFDTFCLEVRKQFLPSNAVKSARDKLALLRQTKSAQEYVNAFQSLCLQIPGISSDEQLDRFCRGLKEKTRLEVELREPTTLADAIRIAVRHDTVVFKHAQSFRSFPSRSDFRAIPEVDSGPQPMEIGAVTHQSGSRNKMSSDERSRLMNAGACFYCKEKGHTALVCPKKKVPSSKGPHPKNGRSSH
jgi:hypothetical protein